MEIDKIQQKVDLYAAMEGIVDEDGDGLRIVNRARLVAELIDLLAYNAVFADTPEVRGATRFVIKQIARAQGCASASIHDLYVAMGKGEVPAMTVPAINIRGLSYDTARAIVRAAASMNAGAFIFEIAKSEISYTFQRPAEYVAVMLAACIKEGYTGPVFIQGDHFQVSAKKYAEDPKEALAEVRELIKEAVPAGFYNIDIDTSTLVDLSHATVMEQQRHNFEHAAELTQLVRSLEPHGVTVSVGGEIGEVGEKNSTVEEFVAFMEGYLMEVPSGMAGISKISVQTGTSHGGVPTADGKVADVALDFTVLKDISRVAREKYKLSGTVQHGASTLPDDAFNQFVANDASEVHLATGFQNMIYESAHLPKYLQNDVYGWLRENLQNEEKEGQTEAQFLYKTRKKGFGPFREQFWVLSAEVRGAIAAELEDQFRFLFEQLSIRDSRPIVDKFVKTPNVPPDLQMEISMAQADPYGGLKRAEEPPPEEA